MGSMLRRCHNWDYRQRAIYMITVTVPDHRPLLGHLTGGEADAAIQLTPAGEMVSACWREIPARYPGVTLMECQVMPDHLHGIIFAHEPQPKPLGSIVGAFKSHSSSLFKKALPSVLCRAACGSGAKSSQPSALWSPGYQDTILFRKGQLANMRGYIRDNPRRLAVKRAHPDLFRIVRDLPCCGTRFSAIGNHFLLDRPIKQQVQCSRSISPEALAAQEAELLSAARHGAVLVSPCISPGEKRIARAALNAEHSLIVLLENGFPPLYKPPGRYFEACAAGRLLMLAPWSYHSDKRTISREQCLALNAYAKACCQ